jgi:hypothetical protein
MYEENNQAILPDGYKWLVISPGGRKIFDDIRYTASHINVSESTFHRRIKESGDKFRIKGHIVMRIPYYKSKRRKRDE